MRHEKAQLQEHMFFQGSEHGTRHTAHGTRHTHTAHSTQHTAYSTRHAHTLSSGSFFKSCRRFRSESQAGISRPAVRLYTLTSLASNTLRPDMMDEPFLFFFFFLSAQGSSSRDKKKQTGWHVCLFGACKYAEFQYVPFRVWQKILV